MIRLFLLFIVSLDVLAWEQHEQNPDTYCKPFLEYRIESTKIDVVSLCRDGYYNLYDVHAKIPVFASYLINPDSATGCSVRSNKFKEDLQLPAYARSRRIDYTSSGYDQGHNVPDGDQSSNEYTELESFLYSNMMPQLPNFNRGIWKKLEELVRYYTLTRNHPLQVITGPIYSNASKKIGIDVVTVPDKFYKIIIDTITKESISFIIPHKAGLDDLSKYISTIDNIEIESGLNIKNLDVNESFVLWNVDNSVKDDKVNKCKIGKGDYNTYDKSKI